MNKATKCIHIQFLMWTYAFISLESVSRDIAGVCLALQEINKLLSKLALLFCSTTSIV